MAKKPMKKKSKPAKASKPSAKKATAKKPAVKKQAPVMSTGKGATAAELGAKLVSLFNQNKADDWIKTVWSKDVESIEGTGQVHRGLKQIMEKWAWWSANNEVIGASAEGPYVGATGFAARFTLEVKDKSSGNTVRMNEVAVYTVKNGKIVREEFMYGS